MSHKYAGGCDHIHTHSDNDPIDNHTLREELTCECIAPGSLDTSLSHAAGLSDIAVCHA